MSYDGFGNNITLDAAFASGFSFPMSVVFWIKNTPANWAQTSSSNAWHFNNVAFGSGDNTNTAFCLLNNNAADRVSARQFDSGGIADTNNHSFTDGQYDNLWVPVIGVFRSNANRQIYIGDSAGTSGPNTASRTIADSFQYLRMGASAVNGFGSIDNDVLIAEVAVFDKALTDAEIDALQTTPQAGPAPNTVAPANCVGYWPLDSDLSSHPDQSGNGGPAMIENGAITYNADHPNIASGPVQASVRFSDIDGLDRSNLSQVPWAWYDALPTTLISPTDSGSGSTTVAGAMTVDLPNTTLSSGQVGYMVVDTGSWQGIYAVTVS